MFRFIHAADVHLDSPLVGLDRYETAPVEAMRGATRRAFQNLVRLAIEERVAFVLLAGDLYDGDWKDYRTGLFFVEQMGILQDAGIRVFVVAGNHDAKSQITKHLRRPDNVHFLSTKHAETRILDDFGVAIHGQGFSARSTTENLAAGYPLADGDLFHIGLLHTSLDGREGHANYAPASRDDLTQKGYQYLALGHVHKREVVSVDPWIVFPGNLQGRHARETGSKGCMLVSVDDGEVSSVEERFVDVARWSVCRIDADGAATTNDVLDRAMAAVKGEVGAADGRALAIRIEIVGATASHGEFAASPERWVEEMRAIASSFSTSEVWIEKVRVATTRPVDLAALWSRDDALGALLRDLHDTRDDDEERAALRKSLSELRAALPRELLEGEGAVDLDAPDVISQLINEARELLLARITKAGGES